jgi:hypothetical protein
MPGFGYGGGRLLERRGGEPYGHALMRQRRRYRKAMRRRNRG